MIRQAFIRQMPVSIRVYLAAQPNSVSLEDLAILADRALASENDVQESKHGVAEIKVSESAKLDGLLEDLSRLLKKLETSAVKKKHYGHKQPAENRENKQSVLPNVQAKPFLPNVSQDDTQGVFPVAQQVCGPNASPPNIQQNNASKPTDINNAQVCYYYQTFGDNVRLCSEPCYYYEMICSDYCVISL